MRCTVCCEDDRLCFYDDRLPFRMKMNFVMMKTVFIITKDGRSHNEARKYVLDIRIRPLIFLL